MVQNRHVIIVLGSVLNRPAHTLNYPSLTSARLVTCFPLFFCIRLMFFSDPVGPPVCASIVASLIFLFEIKLHVLHTSYSCRSVDRPPLINNC